MSDLRSKIDSFFKVLIAALLFGVTQTTPIMGFMGPMIAPLLVYVLAIPSESQYAWQEFISIFEINGALFLGGIIFYIGLTVFCIALLQWFWYHHKKLGLFNRGLYSKTRHPQFLGIIIVTLGLTVKELTSSPMWGLIGVPFAKNSYWIGVPELVGLWFIQALGYVAFAVYEEQELSKKLFEYKEYKKKVPLLLPIKNPK